MPLTKHFQLFTLLMFSSFVLLGQSDWKKCLTSADIHLENLRYEEAIKDATKAISLNPKCLEAYEIRAYARHYLGFHEDENRDVNFVIDNSENQCHNIFRLRAICNHLLGFYEKSNTDFDLAIRVNAQCGKSIHEIIYIYDWKALNYELLGQDDKAIQIYQLIIDSSEESAIKCKAFGAIASIYATPNYKDMSYKKAIHFGTIALDYADDSYSQKNCLKFLIWIYGEIERRQIYDFVSASEAKQKYCTYIDLYISKFPEDASEYRRCK